MYAKILQDIEEKKAVERGRHLLNQPHTSHMRRNLVPSNQIDFLPPDAVSTRPYYHHPARFPPEAAFSDEIGSSYEELSQLEDVCTGIPEDQLDAILQKTVVQASSETSKCPICLDDYVQGEECTTLPCTHVFHYSCMRKCLLVKKTCPLCKVYVL